MLLHSLLAEVLQYECIKHDVSYSVISHTVPPTYIAHKWLAYKRHKKSALVRLLYLCAALSLGVQSSDHGVECAICSIVALGYV